ncbi:hypothetical protein PMZ80_010474 [Knufia obscura]|uniref:FAD-binding domain-containing protein n=2 Tax=Knufia TaxID=430999 RepID=A0AAN8EMN0_9EURO|nr:hypothetical protein PMZ80_010474 [Knufia obscura]KAK5950176.1 hypothetical protein OHC33_008891 [Knufia fluminis]
MHVAIIGGGAAGLSIALTLHSRGIACTIYESKDAPYRGLGALMLAPNALRLLDSLGLYQQLRSRGFNFSTVEFRDESDNAHDKWQMGNRDKYGYDALRITRPAFLDVLRAAVDERGIKVKYGARYSHVVEETQKGVTFQLGDGTRVQADILVGADGVYSEVRKSIAPTIQPIYSGTLALIATIKRRFANTDLNQTTKPPQTTFFHSQSNALLVLPQEHDGSQACLGTQRKYPEQSREDWVHLGYDKDKLYNLFMQDASKWPARVQDTMSQIDKNDIYIWPFYALPDLPSWTSLPHRRTILVGDAAHSIPPIGGQGACQAIETAYTLAMVISTMSKIPNAPADSFAKSIESWQSARQERVQKARLFTKQLDNNRLPQAERAKLPAGTYWEAGQHPDLSWLYGAGLANSEAKGVTRVKVQKSPTGKRGTVTHVRAATVDGTIDTTANLQNLRRVGTEDIIRGAC